MVLLLHTPFVRSEYDAARKLVRFSRSAQGFSSIQELETSYQALIQSTQGLELRHLGLLIDLRDAPPRNDPAFEQSMARHRKAMMRWFGRVAVLVRSAVGKLQVRRHAQDDGIQSLVTQEEDEALRYLGAPRPVDV